MLKFGYVAALWIVMNFLFSFQNIFYQQIEPGKYLAYHIAFLGLILLFTLRRRQAGRPNLPKLMVISLAIAFVPYEHYGQLIFATMDGSDDGSGEYLIAHPFMQLLWPLGFSLAYFLLLFTLTYPSTHTAHRQ